MIKQLTVVAAACLLMSTASMASGFYVGAGVGPDTANIKVTSNVSNYYMNGIYGFNVKNDTQLSGTGVFGTLFVGYGKKLSELGYHTREFYLAGEFNANASTLQQQSINNEFVHSTFSTTTIRMRYNYGLSILPGYFVASNSLVYARAGLTNSNFKISTSDISLVNINRMLRGFRLGLGLQQTLTPALDIRAEYTHVAYRNTNTSTYDVLGNVSKTTQYTPSSNEVEFSLIYKFNHK